MKKKIVNLILIILGVLFISAFITVVVLVEYHVLDRKYYIELSNNNLFFVHIYALAVSLSIFSIAFFLVPLGSVKKTDVFYWLTGILSLGFLVIGFGFIINELPFDVGEFIIVFFSLAIGSTLVFFLIKAKNKIWTKYLVIIGLSILSSIGLAASIAVLLDANSKDGGYKNVEVLYIDRYDPDHQVIVQESDDYKREVYSRRLFANVYSYKNTYGDSFSSEDWVSPENRASEESLRELSVESVDDLIIALNDINRDTIFLLNSIDMTGNSTAFSGIKDKYIEGVTEENKISLIFNSCVIRECNNISFNNIQFVSDVKLNFCNGILFSKCKFSPEEDVDRLFYVDDFSKAVVISDCSFDCYSKDAISLPLDKNIVFKYNDINSSHDNIASMLKIRPQYVLDINLSGFYYSLLSNVRDYNFDKSDGKSFDFSNNLSVGPFSDIVTEVFSYSSSLGDAVFGTKENIEIWGWMIDYFAIYHLTNGIPYIVHEPALSNYDRELPDFKYINPDVIDWYEKNLLPEPTSEFGEYTFQELYNNVLSYQAQIYLESYIYLNQNYNIQEETDWYIETCNMETYMPEALKEHYVFIPRSSNYSLVHNKMMPSDYDYISSNSSKLLGFWMRREMDGTAEKLFNLLSKIVKNYDPDYYIWLTTDYGINQDGVGEIEPADSTETVVKLW